MPDNNNRLPDKNKGQNMTDGAAALGCLGAVIFYFFLGATSMMLHLNAVNHYGLVTPAYLTYGTKPYWSIPVVVLGLLWLGLRRRFPDAARGVRFALFVSAALSLGATAVCR